VTANTRRPEGVGSGESGRPSRNSRAPFEITQREAVPCLVLSEAAENRLVGPWSSGSHVSASVARSWQIGTHRASRAGVSRRRSKSEDGFS
jgi:hypothetical protein